MSELRSDLPALPERMKHLPLDHRGFPVPWFVQWFYDEDGDRSRQVECDHGVVSAYADFRVMDGRKLGLAIKQKRCWVCGDRLGSNLAFVIGPMCAVNRVISEPPSHLDCAVFSATACPFLSRPRMKRNEKDLPAGNCPAGFGLKRNPGVACVWVTRRYSIFRPHVGAPGILFKLGAPDRVFWFAEGREATREEVMASIESGYPLLKELADQEGPEALRALEAQFMRAMPLVPAESRSL